MSRVRYPLAALNAGGQCLVCGEAADKRVELVVADGVVLREGSYPLCAAHAGSEARRWVRVTLVLGSAKVLPVLAAWAMARALDLPQLVVIGLAVTLAAALALAERAVLAGLQPAVLAVGRGGDSVELEIRGEPPPALSPGGPPVRSVPTALHRSRQRLPVAVLVAAASALVAGWQWSLARPTLYVHNPSPTEATVTVDGEAHTLAAGASIALSPGVGRHQAVLATAAQRLELPVELAHGQPMLLATEPACYAIGVPMGSDMHAEGQLFTLGTGEWRAVQCGQ